MPEAGEPEAAQTVGGGLEELVRRGAREMLARALDQEVEEFLGRGRYERTGAVGGYRNGYAPERTVGTGMGRVEVRAPRVARIPEEAGPGFRSTILPRYQRRTAAANALFAQLYLEGLSSGDFEPVFRELLGEAAPLSSSTILRLKDEWKTDYESWRGRPLSEHRFGYIVLDGIYLGCGQEREKTVVLCVLGVREDGTKELIAMEEGYRESTESWKEAFRSLRERGLQAPLLAIGDGCLGAWAALDAIFPSTRHQRCWNHRVLNLQDKLPKRLHSQARRELRAMWESPTRNECEARRDQYVAHLHEIGQTAAADTVLRDWEDFVSFYDFPLDHWLHLRTSNAIESIFSGVRLRTHVAQRMGNRENALYLVFKIVDRLSRNWRALNGGHAAMALLLAGARFRNGVAIATEAQTGTVAA
jgi:transposase-like protein